MKNNKRDLPGAQNTAPLQPGKAAKAADLSRQRRKLIKASAAAVPAIMTLRSGSVAAMASVYQCLNHPDTNLTTTSDISGIDPVLRDHELDPPHDEWLRVAAKPGICFTYITGGGVEKTYYLIRREDVTSSSWTDIDGWHIYDGEGRLKSDVGEDADRQDLLDDENFMNAWESEAIEFYAVVTPEGLDFIQGPDDPVVLPVPPALINDMESSSYCPYLVFLLCYVDQVTLEMTYYPMEQGEAMLITGSCLCSINPSYQIL